MSRDSLRFAIFVLALALSSAEAGCKRGTPAPVAEIAEPTADQTTPAKTEPRFPRRLLFISLKEYAFMPPLTMRTAGSLDPVRKTANTLGSEFKVPLDRDNPQVFILSDLATIKGNNPITKSTLIETSERFFDTSRADHKIVIYFGGHAVEAGGKAYLALIDGDPGRLDSLLPLEDFYSKLKACRAAQKIVIWDVCRSNPEKGRKKESGPMTASLSKLLSSAPAGVEVVITCQAGEHALEFDNLQVEFSPTAPRYSGSSFLESVQYIADHKRIEVKAQTPADPIPIADWTEAVAKRVSEVAAKADLRQTVRYFPKRAEPKTETPAVEPPPPPPDSRTLKEVQAIEEEFRVPPFKSSDAIALTTYPFRDEVLVAYKGDVTLDEIRKNPKKYSFRIATLNAFQAIRDVWVFKAKGGLQRREMVATPISDTLKREIKKELDAWAIGIEKLAGTDRILEALAPARKAQPKRWQAHYDYARALVKSRLAFMNEYDKLQGDVLTETLPPLEKSQNGYRLVSSEKMKSKKDIQKIAEEAQEAFDTVITEHKDTPWALQAKLEKNQHIGLIWEPMTRPK